MEKRFDLLVFDWDGTLVDSAAHIVACIQAACADLELTVPAAERARYIIGLGLQEAMQYLLPDLPPAHYPRLAERYRCHFLSGEAVRPFAGVREGIVGLHAAGYLLGVATGKSRRGLDRALQDTGLAAYFHASRCADEGRPKPHPEMLEVLMHQLGASADRTLMIGDTTHDLAMARDAGVAALAVSYGAHPLEALQAFAPAACLSCVAELIEWLNTNG